MNKTLLVSAFFLSASAHAASPTFSKEVVRIFQHDCQTCHRPGGLAPFSLVEFQDAKAHVKSIAREVAEKTMPPWKPEAGCGDFEDNRALSQADIDTIQAWANAGAPEGDPSDLPPRKEFPSQWTLGQPDVTLKSPQPYPMGADDEDEYRCFTLPWQAATDLNFTGLEVLPDKASVTHHAIIYLDAKGDSLALPKPNDPKPGYECFGGAGFKSAVMLGGWVPGNTPAFLPQNTYVPIPAGSRIVMQIHYHKDGKPELDQSQLGLHFAHGPVSQPLYVGAVYDMKNLYIPAGKSDYTITAEQTLKSTVKIASVTPHMHLLGRKIGMEAILPNGQKQCLVQINDWDFHWQGTYRYKNFISLPAGTTLRMTGVYDNSSANPDNPNTPPIDVKWGDRTVDEMFITFFNFVLN
jgi:hypothetical protein